MAKVKSKREFFVISSVAFGGLLIFYLVVLKNLGLLNFTDSASDEKAIATAVGLVGGFVGSLVTVVGLVLKYTLDEKNYLLQKQTLALQSQTEERVKTENDRSNLLAMQAQRRTEVEASIQAISLMTSTKDKKVTRSERAAAMLLLADLKSYPLCLSLTNYMLEKNRLDAGPACWLLNQAMQVENKVIATQASDITRVFVNRMLKNDGTAFFPAVLLGSDFFKLIEDVRMDGCNALIDLMMLKQFSEWHPDTFFSLFSSLHLIWKNTDDAETDIKYSSGIALSKFVQAYKSTQTLWLKAGEIKTNVLIAELEEYKTHNLAGALPTGAPRSVVLANWK